MAAEDFFSRWAKKNQEAQEARAAEPAPPPPPDPYEGRVPTQEDLDQLDAQADFSPFMKQGVDEGVKRSALKKLFSDPHFNIMDGLDVYIDDYTKPDPIPPEMMAMLQHAKGLFEPEGLKDKPVMAMQSEADLPQLASEGENAVDGDSQRVAVEPDAAAAQEQASTQANTQSTDQDEQGQLATGQDRPANTPPAAGAGANDTSGQDPETETPQP